MLDLRRRQHPFGRSAARAQQGQRMRRIGVLMSSFESDVEAQQQAKAFIQ